MRPGNRLVRTLSASPIAPGVTAHSIIPVQNEGPTQGQDDGVVRRILYEHLGIPCGLECEVPGRVDAAVARAPKPEPSAVKVFAIQDP
jgi:hypothetical protein